MRPNATRNLRNRSYRSGLRTDVKKLRTALAGGDKEQATALLVDVTASLDRLAGKAFDLRRFWRNAVLRACLGREVAGDVVPQRADEAFIIGLLQDCGVIALIPIQGSAYARLMSDQLPPAVQFQREEAEFPYSHVEAIQSLAYLRTGLRSVHQGNWHIECPTMGHNNGIYFGLNQGFPYPTQLA